ncbi:MULTISPECIES: glycosyltransferase [Arthrobacter]|uniref:Rhamnosyltransferase n=1 Tax=Arthrobacter bambusae TaxID=1338426 RepID=A0AAW8DHB7_9MICC|nr:MULTISPECIES: glycosyltransferase [Arthrobacter]MDP9905087.1 rhamnosyltransferase [Arthrobacter bambusae]MDQ0129903.1 rhamnosyltransferase [Arthrobacter bambusae]MDQ0181283.1 rhamnosyltransferase [Arthrobacter bambusae]
MIESPQRRTAAVIAAFNPDDELLTNAESIATQVDELIVVDDCSTSPASEQIFDHLAGNGTKVLRLDNNSGIAAALNRGLEELESTSRPDFVLTFDQDSLPVPDYVSSALATYDRATAEGQKVGFVSAETFSGHQVPVLGASHGFPEAFDPMQSGFFIPMTTLADVGNFESGFFIDCVDSEFTARVRAAGYSILIGAGCEVGHRLGARLPAKVLGRPLRLRGNDLSFNYYSPFRMYYIMRNGTTLARRYWRRNPAWVIRRMLEDAKAQLLRFAFSPDRRYLAIAAWEGLIDSCRGRQGRISQDLLNRIQPR